MIFKNKTLRLIIFTVLLLVTFSLNAQQREGANNPPTHGRSGIDNDIRLKPGEALELYTRVVDPERDQVISERSEEVYKLTEIFRETEKNNALTTAEGGEGKSVLIIETARYLEEELPKWQIRSLDLGLIEAGASFEGQFLDRVENLKSDLLVEAERIKAEGGVLILAIDEAHRMLEIGNGATDNNNILNQLKNFFNDPRVRLWFLTTNREALPLQRDLTIQRRMKPHRLSRMSLDQVKQIVKSIAAQRIIKAKAEYDLDIKVDRDALYFIVEKAADFIHERTPVDAAREVVNTAFTQIITHHSVGSKELAILKGKIKRLQSEIEDTMLLNNATEDIISLQKRLEAAQYEKTTLENTETKTHEEVKLKRQLSILKEKMDKAQSLGHFDKAGRIEHKEIPELNEKIAFLAENPSTDTNPNHLDKLKAAQVISEFTQGVPPEAILNVEAEGIENLESKMAKNIVGHKDLIKDIQSALEMAAYSNIPKSVGPMYLALLDGPSRTGKTEVVKQLAYALGRPHVVLNMSKYTGQSGHSTAWGSDRGIVDAQ